jgi:integrase/recombinase XerD
VCAIPYTRADQQRMGYLTRDAMAALLAAPDRAHWGGRRAHARLLPRDHSGARVSAITALRRAQVCWGAPTCLDLPGQGRKERTVPRWPQTRRVLQTWFREGRAAAAQMAFPNTRGKPLPRPGGRSLRQQVVHVATTACPSLRPTTVSPHVIRHTTAMHLLQAGVDIAVIALWLGHESLETTPVYREADLATKERALQKLTPIDAPLARFPPDDPLLAFLTSR